MEVITNIFTGDIKSYPFDVVAVETKQFTNVWINYTLQLLHNVASHMSRLTFATNKPYYEVAAEFTEQKGI